MRRTSLLSIVAAAIAVGTAACVPPGGPGPAPGGGNSKTDCATRSTNGRGLAVVGLVADGSLVCFRDNNTTRLATIGTLTGFDQDTSLIGLDYRPANDTLYGVGNAGGVYTVDARRPPSSSSAGSTSRCRAPRSASTSTPRSIACASCPTPARTSASTSTTARRPGRHVEHPRRHAGQPGPRRDRRRLHEQRRRPEHGHHAVRHRHDERQHRHPGPGQRRVAEPDRQARCRRRPRRSASTSTAVRDGTTVDLTALASIATADGATSLYGVDLLAGRTHKIGAFDQAVVDIAVPTAQR